ncbi:MAG: hypothetical protein GXP32_06775 [Kiritimatiellaeota bacterium]|nr:hypothetical protein [Kiritimatiellota bacterium]
MKTREDMTVIVYDAKTGIRYWDSPIPSGNPEKQAEFIKTALLKSLEKRRLSKKGLLKHISISSVENIDLPKEKNTFCEAVAILLARRLGNSANFAVLERRVLIG